MNKREKDITDEFVEKLIGGESFHRYAFEKAFEELDKKKYMNPQTVERLLKELSDKDNKYKPLFEHLYGNMPKYRF